MASDNNKTKSKPKTKANTFNNNGYLKQDLTTRWIAIMIIGKAKEKKSERIPRKNIKKEHKKNAKTQKSIKLLVRKRISLATVYSTQFSSTLILIFEMLP